MLRECILRTVKRWYSASRFSIEKNRVSRMSLWFDMRLAVARSPLLIRAFVKVWGSKEGDVVIEVRSWRSALIRTPSGVIKSVVFYFWWFK